MKRFHMHLAVSDLASNIRFYSQLFGAAPTVEKDDYAKWMLDDPRINFAISARGAAPGVDHIGIQVESEAELAELKQRYDAADAAAVTTETGMGCCYMESNKHWLTDPQGIAWEAYHSLAEIPTFSKAEVQAEGSACCAPRSSATKERVALNIPVVAANCTPAAAATAAAAPTAAKSCC
ncbi:MAG: hypothetical protein RL748_99 [Pseudomonadota bacterium]